MMGHANKAVLSSLRLFLIAFYIASDGGYVVLTLPGYAFFTSNTSAREGISESLRQVFHEVYYIQIPHCPHMLYILV
jgi:hypothetical protein